MNASKAFDILYGDIREVWGDEIAIEKGWRFE